MSNKKLDPDTSALLGLQALGFVGGGAEDFVDRGGPGTWVDGGGVPGGSVSGSVFGDGGGGNFVRGDDGTV